MPNELDALINQWYTYLDKGQRFFVTAINDTAKTIEVQHFDGDVEEFGFDEWPELNIELCEEPENWSGALDIAEQDDFGTEVTDTSARDWADPQQEYRGTAGAPPRPDTEVANDDFGEGYGEEEPLE